MERIEYEYSFKVASLEPFFEYCQKMNLFLKINFNKQEQSSAMKIKQWQE